MSQLRTPPLDLPLQGKYFILDAPGYGPPAQADLYNIDATHGPRNTSPKAMVSDGVAAPASALGGPVTSAYAQTQKRHWQTNFFGYGDDANGQGSPVPDTNMNTRKVLYAYRTKGDGTPDPPQDGFKVFLMFDFIFWAEDPNNDFGWLGLSSSAPEVDVKATKWPPFTTALVTKTGKWPKFWLWCTCVGLLTVGLAALTYATTKSLGRSLVLAIIVALNGLAGYFVTILDVNAAFNKIKWCATLDKPSCWTGNEDQAYENAEDRSIYTWKEDRRTFGGLPEIGACWGYQYRNRLLQYLVYNGFCVILPGFANVNQIARADYKEIGAFLPFKEECQDWYWPEGYVDYGDPAANVYSQNNSCAGGWPGPDAAFLATLLDEMYDGSHFGLGKANSGDKPCLNLQKLTLGGYSAGAQMCSRCMQEFPVMVSPKKRQFPPIKAVMMLSGGSYFCYTGPNAYGDTPAPAPSTPFSTLCGKQDDVREKDGAENLQCAACPPIFEGKTQAEIQRLIGCCPQGRLEARYENSPEVSKHPPVILAQTYNDSDADNNASAAYYLALRSALRQQLGTSAATSKVIEAGVQIVRTCWSGDKCSGKKLAAPRNANITGDECSPHTWFPEMIVPVAKFLSVMADVDGYFFEGTKVPDGLPTNVLACPAPA